MRTKIIYITIVTLLVVACEKKNCRPIPGKTNRHRDYPGRINMPKLDTSIKVKPIRPSRK